MIKIDRFVFEAIEGRKPWVDFPYFGKLQDHTHLWLDSYHEFQQMLNPAFVYQISLDQSSSNTGIFIKDSANVEAFMIEVRRDKKQNAEDYIFDLEMFLHALGEGNTFSHVLYERPIKTESFRSSQVLFQLEGMVKLLGRRYTEFRTAKIDCIENAAWRSVIVSKELSAKYTRKEASRVAVANLWKWTTAYGMSIGADQDIFEAIGVMMGWFFCSYDVLGNPYVRGDKTTHVVGGYCLPKYHAKEISEMLNEAGVECNYFVSNPKYSVCMNLTADIQPYTVKCVEFTEPYSILCLCVECNLKFEGVEVLTVILCDASTVPDKIKEIAGSEFHFVV